jgi:hypothetical protein
MSNQGLLFGWDPVKALMTSFGQSTTVTVNESSAQIEKTQIILNEDTDSRWQMKSHVAPRCTMVLTCPIFVRSILERKGPHRGKTVDLTLVEKKRRQHDEMLRSKKENESFTAAFEKLQERNLMEIEKAQNTEIMEAWKNTATKVCI